MKPPLPTVEESYGLSPTQQGMLLHTLREPRSGVDVEQVVLELHEPLRFGEFVTAWQRVVARHPILRTAFRWQGLDRPVQDVCREVSLPVERLDWSGLSTEERERRYAALLLSDRETGFDLDRVPLMRLALVRLQSELHRVIWTFHHALLDGRSFPLVLREVLSLYDNPGDVDSVLGSPPRAYREYIGRLERLDLSAAERYWRSALRGFSAPTPLVVGKDRPEDPLSGGRSGGHEVRLAKDESAALREFAKKQGVTPNTMLQGAWALLLHRYSGEEDVVFGATRACRRSVFDDAGSMIGLFINTLPMRVIIDPESRVVPFLQSLREQQVALREVEHTPLYRVQSWSEVPGGTALFDSLVVFDNRTLDAMMHETRMSSDSRRFRYRGQTNFPLTVIGYGDDSMLLRIEHDRRMFEDEPVGRMLGHLRHLLRQMVAFPDRRLWELALVSESERASLIASEQRLPQLPPGVCLHEQFEAQAARQPEAIALTMGETQLTYADLNRRANRLAHRLRERGVGPDVLVGLCLERSTEMVVGILGILKAGGAYLPLDPAYPAERLAFMLEDAAVPVVVTAGDVELPQHSAAVVRVDEVEPALETDPRSGVGPDNLAYVIYTSGSTGRPKGVPITHHNVDRLFRATEDWFHFDERDVWTLFHSYAFDFSVWELWGPLLYGGRLVVVPYWVSRSPEAFLELVRSEHVTVLNQTPSAFRQLIQTDVASGPPQATSLRYVIFGGEALELQSLRPWFERHGDERPQLINMYGITETCVHVTYRPIELADLESGLGSVIGVPIPDLRVYVLDPHGQPVPLGVPGEMYVGGAGVTPRGYLGRPELTAERFVDDPFVPGGRLYRTGDLARWFSNGELEYLGRIDHQVKIRGFRIELGEIESVLAKHEAVKECVVLAREDVPGDRRLVAYLAAAGEETALSEELRAAARSRLPDYMIPAAFVFLDTLPLTPNGKIDRKALPAPASHRPDLSETYVAPRDESERILAGIWTEVLGAARVGVHDNFFELGGDSILAIQVLTRAREAGLVIDLRELFERPTVAELAAASTEAPQRSPRAATVDSGPIPFTPIQKWFFEQRLPTPEHWNQSFLFEIAADADLDAFDRALTTVVGHHPALRFRYRRDGDAWIQTVDTDAEPPAIERVDLSTVGDAELPEAVESDAAQRQASLGLSQGPVLRAVHYDLGSEQAGRLLLVVHHLVIDGVSWRILMEDLDRAWQAEVESRPTELPSEGTSFAEWAATLSELATAGRFDESLEFWTRGAATSSSLSADGDPTIEPLESRSNTVRVELDAETTGALLRDVPGAYRTQINDVLLAALARAMGETTGEAVCRIDLEGHGREPLVDGNDLSRTIGWFTSIYPVDIELRPDAGPGDDLKSVKEQLRGVPDRGVGFGVLRYLGDKETSTSLAALPRAEILFNYLGRFDQVVAGTASFERATESVGPWHNPTGRRTHALEILAQVAGGRLRLDWTFTEGVWRTETIQALAELYFDRLRALIDHARASETGGVTPSDFPLADLDQSSLDRLPVNPRRIDDLYPLSPMQELFFSMESPGSTVGFEQWRFRLDGPVDSRALRTAWNDVVRRHAILRTAFVSVGLPRPMQLVLRDVEIPWTEEDWRDLDEAESRRRLDEFLGLDLKRGFDLHEAPLLRVALIRTGEQTWELVWSTHHLLVDGWSWPLIFSELSACYGARLEGRSANLRPPGRYRDYIAWIEQHETRSESFWRLELDGFEAPTPTDLEMPGTVSPGFDEQTLQLTESLSEALRARARERRLTLNAIAQGAWAVLLAHYADTKDVSFGAAFSGRPPDVAGIASVVGPCVSNVPVRVQLAREQSIDGWLAGLHSKLSELSAHQYASPRQIQEWSKIPVRHRLFESLLVFQNYLADDDSGTLGASVRITPLDTPEATAYPWTLSLTPADTLRLRLLWPAARVAPSVAESMLSDLQLVFEALADRSLATVGDLLDVLPSDSRGRAAEVLRQRSAAAHAPAVKPVNAMESKIAAIWRELFQVDAIGVEQNFFDLGGHSLLLIQAHARLCEALARELPVVDLLRFPTVRGLARHLSDELTPEGPAPSARDRARLQREAMARRRPAPRRG